MREPDRPRRGDPLVVCHLVEHLSFGGAQNVVQRLVSQLLESRYDPIVCCLEPGPLQPVLEQAGIAVESLNLRRRSVLSGPLYIAYVIRLARTLAAVVRRRRVALIHAHLPDAILLATLVGRMSGTPVVATYHGLRIVPPNRSRLDPRNAVRRTLYRLTGRLVDKTVAVSVPVRQMLCGELGFSEDDTVLILNGIETEKLARVRAPDGLRSELGIDADHRVITCVGRFVEHKGQHVLIEAMVHVLARYPKAVLVLVGDGRSREAAMTLTSELGLHTHVRFVGSRSDVPEILALTEVFSLTSFYEGIPLSVLEAMATGTPVVATRVPGNEDVLVDDRFGLLVPPNSPKETAEAICSLLSSPERARNIAERARARAREEFDIQCSVQRTLELYDEVLHGREPGPSSEAR